MDKVVGEAPPFAKEQRHIQPNTPDLARQILSSSGTMIAMCTTMVGLFKVAEGRLGSSKVDIFAALLGATFLVSAMFAYVSIRTAKISAVSKRCERAADTTFLTGLIAAVVVVILFAFEAI
jgi:hypothetical protein